VKEILGIKVYTTKEVAEILGKSPTTVRNYIYEQKLGAIQIGRDLLIPEKELMEFIRKSANKLDIKL